MSAGTDGRTVHNPTVQVQFRDVKKSDGSRLHLGEMYQVGWVGWVAVKPAVLAAALALRAVARQSSIRPCGYALPQHRFGGHWHGRCTRIGSTPLLGAGHASMHGFRYTPWDSRHRLRLRREMLLGLDYSGWVG